MKRKRYTEEQIISILKKAEAGTPVADLCRKHGMAGASFYAWRRKYGGMEVSEAKRLRELVYRTAYRDLDNAPASTSKYINLFYNSRRRHSALGYLSPAAFEAAHDHVKPKAALAA